MTGRVNTIALAEVFQKELDKNITHNLVTGWMDANAGRVTYHGGNTIKLPVMDIDGLGNYGRADGSGFVNGKATVKYETFTMKQDRGRSFMLDRHDVDETNFAVTMGALLGEFQRSKVVPEVDAYRLSKCIEKSISAKTAKYEVKLTKATIVNTLKSAITVIRETGCMEQIVIHITYEAKQMLEEAMAGQLQATTFNIGGVDTRVNVFDGCILIPTPSVYMVSQIDLNDGVSHSQEEGGFKVNSDAKHAGFIAMAKSAPLAITKQDAVRTFTPEQNQSADAWKSDYRRYHDLFVTDAKAKVIVAGIIEAEGPEAA